MNRKIVGIVLSTLLLLSLISIIAFKDELFTSKVKVVYNNGCEELYVDMELVSDKCVEEVVGYDYYNFTVDKEEVNES